MAGSGKSRRLAGMVVVALALMGCRDAAEPGDPVAECLAAAGVTGAAVAIRGFAFVPETLRVPPGTRVTWVNCEDPQVEAHTSTADDGEWDSGLLSPGDSFVRDFDDLGTFPYHCIPHPVTMRAVIIVEAEA